MAEIDTIFSAVDQPTLILNEQIARANIRRMAEKAAGWNVRFRPHFKTHQSAAIGEWFRDTGVQAITVSSVEMAEYFSRQGWTDITIAFPCNIRQLDRVNRLAERINLGVLVESPEVADHLADRLSNPLDVWIKIDVGSHRTGVPADDVERVRVIAERVRASRMMNLKGLLTHAGMTYHQGVDAVRKLNEFSASSLNSLREMMTRMGFPEMEISVGDTPACTVCEDIGNVDEIRPGNFVFYDAMQLEAGVCSTDQVAVAVACPVVALHPERNETVIYGGAIHLSSERYLDDGINKFGLVCLPTEEGWGTPLEGVFIARLSQEHGILSVPVHLMSNFRVGDLVCILPAHSCITVSQLRRYRTLDGKWIETMGSCPT